MRISQINAARKKIALRRRSVVFLMTLQLLTTLFELVSLVTLVPVFQFIDQQGDVESLRNEHEAWGYIIDAHNLVGINLSIGSLLIFSFLCLLARQCLVFTRLRYAAHTKEGIIAGIKKSSFRTFMRTKTAYQEREPVGVIVSNFTLDLKLGVDFVFGFIALYGYFIVGAIYLGTMFSLSVPMTLTALAVGVLAVFAARTQMRKSVVTGAEVVQANQKASSFLIERLNLARLVRLSGTEVGEIEKMRGLAIRQRDTMVRLATLAARLEIIIEPIAIGACFIFIFISFTIFDLGWEVIGLFLVISMRLLPVAKEAARIYQAAVAYKKSFDIVFQRLEEMTANLESTGGERRLDALETGIVFENVNFSYGNDEDAPVLRDLSLTIPAHKMTALVGPSGAGKSTLIDLLPRVRDPSSGTILVDGHNIEDYQMESLRQAISYAPQTAQVFDVTAAEHIRYGKKDATMEEVREAARLAGALNFIEDMPEGFDSRLGEMGRRLSGGQRQRLDLARALVRKAPILVLDEPTSNLDPDSEEKFKQAIHRIRSELGCTIIIVGHRLSTVAAADQIIVLRDGGIAESGDHQELIALGGWYANAYSKQHDERNILMVGT